MTINERIAALRTAMKNQGIAAYIIPSADPHNSEYVADAWKCREWISGFTGSAGTCAVTMSDSGLWTDSRYFLQGEEELRRSEMKLHKMKNQFKAEYAEWLAENLDSGSVVGIDGYMISPGLYDRFKSIFDKKDIKIKTLDLIKEVWSDRPPLSRELVFIHETKYTGKSNTEKLSEIRQKMEERGTGHHLVTTLDDIAWILNLRGRDVDFNPVFISYLVIDGKGAHLFIDNSKVDNETENHLSVAGVDLHPYKDIVAYLNHLTEGDKILVDKGNCSLELMRACNAEVVYGETISRHLKAVKNKTEIAHTRQVMVKDGVALCNAFFWLENELKERSVSEFELAEKLAACRKEQGDYFGESFAAIVGYKSNGAIIHYRPMPGTCADIEQEGILLVDSGGQYFDGTTDITRTIALSTPSDEVRRNFTLVLKGMIDLSMIKFPKGTIGGQLDSIARQHLWTYGLNYLHGTGHGVGFFLNVHEPPQGFASPGSQRGNTRHVPGMISSNEPGYYKEGEYGIRIENLVVCVEEDDGYLSHETVTLMPIDLNLTDIDLLTNDEKSWLNDYHKKVNEALSPGLSNEVREWLGQKTRTI